MRLLSSAGAGTFATAMMSGVMALGKKLGLLGEPPPHRIVRKVLGRPRPARLAAPASLASHFAFGAALGMVHGSLPPALRRSLGVGCAFGALVWAASYVHVLPALGIMPRPSRDRPGRPTTMLVAHLVFGATLAALRRFWEHEERMPPPRTTRAIGLQRAIRGERRPFDARF